MSKAGSGILHCYNYFSLSGIYSTSVMACELFSAFSLQNWSVTRCQHWQIGRPELIKGNIVNRMSARWHARICSGVVRKGEGKKEASREEPETPGKVRQFPRVISYIESTSETKISLLGHRFCMLEGQVWSQALHTSLHPPRRNPAVPYQE